MVFDQKKAALGDVFIISKIFKPESLIFLLIPDNLLTPSKVGYIIGTFSISFKPKKLRFQKISLKLT